MTLDDAQFAKMELIARKLDLKLGQGFEFGLWVENSFQGFVDRGF